MSINTKDLDPLIRFIYSIADDHLINTYEPSKYQVKTTPFTKPKTKLADLVSNKAPIDIPTVKDLVTKVEPSKVENRIIIPKVIAEPSGSGTGKKRTPMKKDSWVMDLQKTINAETGANLVEDGKLGPKTKAAYKVYMDKISDSRNPAGSSSLDKLPVEGLAATAAPKEVSFWERLLQDDRTPEQKAAEQQAVLDKILNVTSDNTGLAAAQYGR